LVAQLGGIVPVGSVVAWHKDLTGVSGLPDGWIECDGSVVNDSEWPLDGAAVLDLDGTGRFLRGNTVSGVTPLGGIQDHGDSISPETHGRTANRAPELRSAA